MALHDTIRIVHSSHSCSLLLFNVYTLLHISTCTLFARFLWLLTYLLTHSLTHHSHTHMLTHSLTHSYTHSPTHSLIHTLMHSTRSLTYSHTNPLIYSLLTHVGVRIHFHHLPLAASSWHSGSVLAGKAIKKSWVRVPQMELNFLSFFPFSLIPLLSFNHTLSILT